MTPRQLWATAVTFVLIAGTPGVCLLRTRGEPLWPGALQAQTVTKKGKTVVVKDTMLLIKDATDSDSETDSADAADTGDTGDTETTDEGSTPVVVGGDSRTLRIARQFRAARDTTAPLRLNLTYGGGTLGIAPADAAWLYDVRLSYSPKRLTPQVRFDTADRTLGIATKSTNITIHTHHVENGGDLRVVLGRGVPLDANIEFGAGEATMQFGGLSLRNLKLMTGASDATIGWNAPNATTLHELRLEIGAAGFKATGLGNAHAQYIVVKAGAGDVDLDFGGRWTSDATMDVTAALGAVHIHLPPGVALQNSSKAIIGAIDDNTGASVGAPQVPGGPIYHLRLTGTATLGSVEIDRHTGG